MNDHWSENYWDNYIKRKFSYNGSSRNLTIVELCKVYDYPQNIFCGHTNNDYIVKVSYWSEENKIYLGIGYGETYYEADDITSYQLFLDNINDEIVLELLKQEFGWNIVNYFSFCE
jgi:hypothetical protein